ncbi:hypothetical protein [Arthrobacter sp. Soil763]|uniref:hypothetical protein n=1 Tax=Arthrobacter sp. Soil763 TaxID=1736402 RepID=UPI0006F1F8C6|nr:hypothetical protein [Arthrobacter sp. Soil763]KRE80005.1 hypothetical protein ASG71_08205 [Arthrobacter sp. Soil763]
MSDLDGERARILSELTDRVWAEYRLHTAEEDRLAAERSAAFTEERLLALGVTAERRREAARFSAWLRETERNHRRAQIAEGLKVFGTFSTETLTAFDRDLRSDGPFAAAMEISLHDGTPHPSRWHRHGRTGSLVCGIQSKFSGERFIRDFLTFQPYNYEIILDAYRALGLPGSVGLKELAAEKYSLSAVEDLLLIGEALRTVQRHRQQGLVIDTGYGAGDEMHERCKHLQHLTPHFARWILTESPSDAELVTKLFIGRGGVFGLTLEGLSADEFLRVLQHYRGLRSC